MIINRTKERIKELQDKPERERISAANKYLIIFVIVAIAIWILVLLPLQIFINNIGTDTIEDAIEEQNEASEQDQQ